MSQTNALENSEELENVALVRMEDVQPRDRNCEVFYSEEFEVDEPLQTCEIDKYEVNESLETYVVNDDEDSNLGSMVSIQSEEVVCAEDDSDGCELIVPEKNETDVKQDKVESKPKSSPDSWPTLEILPGGVIKHGDKFEENLADTFKQLHKTNTVEVREMMYACAKCSQSFKYLFCLVKHVKWHEDEQKKQKGPDLTKLKTQNNRPDCLLSGKRKITKATKAKTKKAPKVPKKS